MKKSYLTLAAVAAIMASCTNETLIDAPVNEDVLIGFETFTDAATKAAVSSGHDLTDENGGFGVWGYKHLDNRAITSNAISVNSDATVVFDNVKVWYKDEETETQGYTYLVPKYWDKSMYYTFFAYAPYNKPDVALNKETGVITYDNVLSKQDASISSTITVGSNSRTQYKRTDAQVDNVIDYLMASCVPGQKYAATNQNGKPGNPEYTDGQREVTVGFTFGHMLSKLNVNLKAKDAYSGVKDIQVKTLSISNLPNNDEKTKFTQTATNAVAGTFAPATYSTALNIISDATGANATSAAPLYILDNGSLSETTITAPTAINHDFHYYIAPNAPATDKKYELTVDYTITYVDGITENVSKTVDLSAATTAFTQMQQNYVYNLTVIVALDQIYFTVDAVTDWANPEVDTDATLN